jgi:hypothetical protein
VTYLHVNEAMLVKNLHEETGLSMAISVQLHTDNFKSEMILTDESMSHGFKDQLASSKH